MKDGRRLWLPVALNAMVSFLLKHVRPVLLRQRRGGRRPAQYRDVYDFGSTHTTVTDKSRFYDNALLLNAMGHPLTGDDIRSMYYVDTFSCFERALRPMDIRRIICSYFYSSEGQKRFGFEAKKITYLLDHHVNTSKEYYAAMTRRDLPHATSQSAFLQHLQQTDDDADDCDDDDDDDDDDEGSSSSST